MEVFLKTSSINQQFVSKWTPSGLSQMSYQGSRLSTQKTMFSDSKEHLLRVSFHVLSSLQQALRFNFRAMLRSNSHDSWC